jgi:hypothetical protein
MHVFYSVTPWLMPTTDCNSISWIIPWNGVFHDKIIVAQLSNPPPIMEPEGPLPCLQEPATALYLDHMSPVHTLIFCFFKIHFNIILPFACLQSGLFVSSSWLKFYMYFSSSTSVLHTPPISSSWFHHPNNISWIVQIMELVIMSSPHLLLPFS